MITKTGDNLIITISCEYLPHHNWMAFASWYSISKNLPDAKCLILCKRGLYKINLYEWTHKCKVPIYYLKDIESFDKSKVGLSDVVEVKNIKCSVMAINTWNENSIGPFDVNTDFDCTFVDYFSQCGKFNGKDWVGKLNSPFEYVDSFYSDSLNLNENKVLKLWGKCRNAYNIIKG
jgi:hypothetical protein